MFATFIFLSLSRVVYETFAVIAGSVVHDANSSVITNVVYFDPTIVQYSSNHIPYMVIALLFLLLLVLCPALLLCLYPTRLYEKLSQCVSARKRIVIKTFAETFQGCFKDGLGGNKDYRMIPGMIFLCTALVALAVSFTSGVSGYSSFSIALTVSCLCTVIAIVLSYLRPCKSLLMNISLSFHFAVIGFVAMMINLWEQDFLIGTETLATAFTVVTAFPHILMFMWAGYNISGHIQAKCHCYLKRSALTRLVNCRKHDYEEMDNSLPEE